VDLNHSFTVPAGLAETWKTFEDIESVAGCFPGATVTEVDGNDFKGTCKVKLGPIAMVYSGTGTFIEKDEAAGKFVIDAKGKDKRGNGTAGALVTATLTDEGGGSTKVDVNTDLAITGKPAQFGRGVIEDISNKLLQQFVTCLQDKVGVSEEPVEAQPVAAQPVEAAVAAEPVTQPVAEPVSAPPQPSPTGQAGAPQAASPSARSTAPQDDALDLGATVLPILARTYGPQIGIAVVALVIGYRLGRRRR
jgi:carbon monoxide dehydrogenase subunit G